MPFQSKRQARACFAKKSRGQAKGWDCKEWADKTNFKKLPEKAASLIAVLAHDAALVTLRDYQQS
jgi:hypothetical protein